MYIAQLTNGIVTSVTQTNGIQTDASHIEIVSFDTSLIGHSYVNGVFTPPAPPVDLCQWLIDIGPFYDRFGAVKMAVLTSADPAVKAIIQDLNIRKWVDLKRADVAQALTYIGSAVPAVTATLQTAILTTPVAAVENLALRKLYF